MAASAWQGQRADTMDYKCNTTATVLPAEEMEVWRCEARARWPSAGGGEENL